MEFVPAGVPLSFEVTFDSPDLDVAMTVYDDTGADPVLLLSPFAMVLVYGNTYRAKFTPANGKSYIVIKGVYTNDAFEDLDPNYSQGSESLYAQYAGSSPGGCDVVGIVDETCDVIGVVDC